MSEDVNKQTFCDSKTKDDHLNNDVQSNPDHDKLTNKTEPLVETDHDPIVQYILIRTDLKWDTGALIAQACHASVASITQTLENSSTKEYLKDLENMHKVVLGTEKIEDLLKVERKLKEANIPHHVWVERPENIITCLAASPQPKSFIRAFFKRLKLLK